MSPGPGRIRRTHDSLDPVDYDARRSGHFEDRRVDLISGVVAAEQPAHVLELGAGSGRICWRLAARHPAVRFTAVEPYRPLADHGRSSYSRPNLQRVDAVASAQKAEMAFSIDVVHHLTERSATFAGLRTALIDGAPWVVVEPNIWHPAIWLLQERMRRAGLDEDHFRPWASEPEFRSAGFIIESRSYRHLWPAAIKRPPPLAAAIERHLEKLAVAGASVVYRLRAGS